VWRQLDPELWEFTQNPWVVLQTVSREKLQHILTDPVFRKDVDDLLLAKRQAAETPAWFQKNHPQSPLKCVAYFSMEYMLSEALPIYSGGLGNVAGDQLKAASDLGVPVVGVGLLYQQGYFRQVIDKDGAPFTRITTLDSCRSRPCGSRTANGCGWRSSCRVTRCGCARGRCKSVG
jgi:starch phosphorylase